jgi:plastocyanin
MLSALHRTTLVFFASLLTLSLAGTAIAATHTVTDVGNTWSPATLNIAPGDTVTWTWTGFHNVQSNPSACSTTAPEFCSGSATTGGTFSHTFNSVGSFAYVCAIHLALAMTGTVNVVAPAVPSMGPIGLGATVLLVSALGMAWRQRRGQTQA